MPCFKPIDAWQHEKNGGSLIFVERKGYRRLQIACGQCIGCRITRSREWATRICHEASLYDDNCFITLTYNAENLPPDCGLRKKHYQLFMKRLRKAYPDKKIRFFHCGEYGDKNNRPHYHAILFNFNFPDWIYLFDSSSGVPIYSSPILESLWGKGFVTIGEVTFQSAAYVARYVLKKINGQSADKIDPETGLKHYERINSFTGEVIEVIPEYCTMSRGGRTGKGIAHDWIKKYSSDIYPKGYTTINGLKVAPPRYYDKYLESIDLDMYDDIKAGRALAGYESPDNTEQRLVTREHVKTAQLSNLKRQL